MTIKGVIEYPSNIMFADTMAGHEPLKKLLNSRKRWRHMDKFHGMEDNCHYHPMTGMVAVSLPQEEMVRIMGWVQEQRLSWRRARVQLAPSSIVIETILIYL